VTGGREYVYVVTSYNVLGGESQHSNQVKLSPIKEPSGMTAPTEVTHTLTSVTLQWVAPASDGAADVVKYRLYHKADYMSSYTLAYEGMTLSHRVDGLRTGFYH
jgi:hypothetical protein